MPVGVVANRCDVRADRIRGVVERGGRIARHSARAVVGLPVKADVVEHDVVRDGEEIDRLDELEIGVGVGERQLRGRREIVDDLEHRGAFRTSARKAAGRRGRRQPLEVAVGPERLADDAAGRELQHAFRVAGAGRCGQIAGRDRSLVDASAGRTARCEHAFHAIGDDSHAHAGAVQVKLRAYGVRMKDGVAFGVRAAAARARVGGKADGVDGR